MENMQYAEELLKEFLVFRGFTNTLQAFETELSTDAGKNFQVEKVLNLIFSVYVPKYQPDKLVGLLNFFKQCFSSTSDAIFLSTLSKLELSVLRYYIVHALQSGRKDKVVEFFGENGNYLLQKREDWMPWFAVPYLKNPSLDPQFRVYFSKDWSDALLLSFRNFLSEIFNGSRIPALLKISTEKNTVRRLKNDIKQLNHKLSQLQALLETKEDEIFHLRRMAPPAESSTLQGNSTMMDPPSETLKETVNSRAIKDFHTAGVSCSSSHGARILGANDQDKSGYSNVSLESSSSDAVHVPSFPSEHPFCDGEVGNARQIPQAENKWWLIYSAPLWPLSIRAHQ